MAFTLSYYSCVRCSKDRMVNISDFTAPQNCLEHISADEPRRTAPLELGKSVWGCINGRHRKKQEPNVGASISISEQKMLQRHSNAIHGLKKAYESAYLSRDRSTRFCCPPENPRGDANSTGPSRYSQDNRPRTKTPRHPREFNQIYVALVAGAVVIGPLGCGQ